MSTPSQIIQELHRLILQNEKGISALYDAEITLADRESELDAIESKAFLSNSGSVADRQAIARLEAGDARLKRDLAKAEMNRVKHKIRMIEQAMSASQTSAKMLDLESRL